MPFRTRLTGTYIATCIALFALNAPWPALALADRHRVQAEIAGFEVDTVVDSAIARQLINANGRRLPVEVARDLDTRLACGAAEPLPDTRSLQAISRDYSPDTATALLIRCLERNPSVMKSQQMFLSELARRRRGDTEQFAFIAQRASNYTVLFVPGWGYLTNSDETGADMARPREIIAALGFENHLVEIEDTGSVEGSARILVAALRKHLRSGKKILLVSASSGGPTVALALRDPAVAGNPRLVGWLNICGVLRGTPVIDAFLPWPKSLLLHAVSFFEGWKYPAVLSLSRTHSKPRFEGFMPPAQLTVLNYVGIPFSGQVSELGREFYSLLREQGPNDGLTLIPDALAPGYTIMAVGMDHFVNNDPQIDLKTAALVPVMLKLIEDREPRAVVSGDSGEAYWANSDK
jgi:hypothetical protein